MSVLILIINQYLGAVKITSINVSSITIKVCLNEILAIIELQPVIEKYIMPVNVKLIKFAFPFYFLYFLQMLRPWNPVKSVKGVECREQVENYFSA